MTSQTTRTRRPLAFSDPPDSSHRLAVASLALIACFALAGCDAERSELPRTGPDTKDAGTPAQPDAAIRPDDGHPDGGAPDSSQEETCGGDLGLDPETGCSTCRTGYEAVESGDDDVRAAGIPSRTNRPDCVRILTCDELDCGSHGTCNASDEGAFCACAPGYAGPRCESCAPLHENVEGTCVLARGCAEQRCGGHGQCVLDAALAVTCQCDEGWDLDEACGGKSIALAAPDELVTPEGRTPLRVGLRHGAFCTGDFTWSVEDGGGVVTPDPSDSTRATYTAPAATGELGRATVRAVCDTDERLSVRRTLPIARGNTAAGPSQRVHGPCPDALAAEIDPVILDWMEAHDIAGGTIGVSIFGAPVCLRAYGYASLGTRADGRRGIEPMRTCTPMRLASVTKAFTRSALRSNLYGVSLPASMGGGTLSGNTPLLPVVDTAMSLGANNTPAWNEPASLYSAGWTFPVDATCTPNQAAMDPAWTLATFDATLNHRAGFQPNQSYRLGLDNACTGAANEGCKSFNNVGDPTVSTSTSRRIANDLGLQDHGVPEIDDVMAWMGGVCMYDTQTDGNYRYSNFGYSVAGRAIELISGKSYEDFVVEFLEADKLIDRTFKHAGRPIVYQGQNLGNGPRSYTLPSYMREARYYSHLGKLTDVTQATFSNGQWTFPNQVDAPYGGANYDLMYAHGGLVANAQALLNYARIYGLRTGRRRPKPFLTVHDDTTRGAQGGLLWGTYTELREFDDVEPVVKQGTGCYVRANSIDDLDELELASCPLPHGVTMALLFNGDPLNAQDTKFIEGRHSSSVLTHGLRRAFSKFSATVEPWLLAILPPNDLAEGCEKKCHPDFPLCIPMDCGDGDVDPGEECDDGNNQDGDGCQATCVVTPTVPQTPPSYEKCQGRPAGECLGGPCGPREEKFVSDVDRLASSSIVHPDGDYSPHTQCRDDYTGGGEAAEAVCRREIYGGKSWGVCRECGVDTMVGCLCPAPNAEDGGCNGIAEDGLSCVGGRCWKSTPPSWMCKVDCQDIYGNSGYCHHDSLKGAVCYDVLCSEEVPGWCDLVQGRVCNSAPNSCKNGSCCEAECLTDADCTARGYDGYHCNAEERCVP